MECIDIGLCVIINDTVRDEYRTALVNSANTVETKTSGKTGHGTKETLKGFGEVVRNVVLVNLERVREKGQDKNKSYDLDHCPPGIFFVLQLCFATDTNDVGVIDDGSNKPIQ